MNNNLKKFQEYFKSNLQRELKSNDVVENEKVIAEFNKEFPIDKIKKLSLDEYIFKKDDDSTFCSRLEKYYQSFGVGPSIRAGSINGKYGIYYKGNNYINYKSDKAGNVIKKPQEYYKELNHQLVEVLSNIKRGNQDVDYTKYDHLCGMWNMILKLAYYINPDNNLTFGSNCLINICKYFNIPYSKKDNSLNLSCRIKKYIADNIVESSGLKSTNIGSLLWNFYEKEIKNIPAITTTWLFQPGQQGIYWEDCKRENKIIIGFQKLGDLTGKSTDELDELLKKAYNKANPYNDRKCLDDFVNNMKPDDVVIIKKGKDELLGYGIVTSDYYFDEVLNQHCRDVKWKKLGLWHNTIVNNVQKTLTNISQYENYPVELLSIINNDMSINVNMFEGKNIIYYGVPGCGKSYQVNEIAKKYESNNVIRTVFHPDYTYSDFIGQVMPITKNKGIFYDRIPGPFTKALAKAYENETKNVLLIIEEINRGNAAAIFGDIFQLLDRTDYEIDNEFICSYLRGHTKNNFKGYKFSLPKNLTIIATMNTSDQNVYTLDNAFRRRFEYVRIANNFENNDYSNELKNISIPVLNISWESFVSVINNFIIEQSDLLLNNEDKRLGAYSISSEELKNEYKFADKVLFYLWDNIGKYNDGKLFKDGYKLYDQVIDDYISGKMIFCDELFDKLYTIQNNSREEENE